MLKKLAIAALLAGNMTLAWAGPALALPTPSQESAATDAVPAPNVPVIPDQSPSMRGVDLPSDDDMAPAPMPVTSADVSALTPFSAAANYMSLPGDYRYLTYEQSGVWLDRSEAVAQVNGETESATR